MAAYSNRGCLLRCALLPSVAPQTLIIPKKALILETDEDDVFFIEDGKVRRVAVELGFVEGDQVEIVSGLKEGDQVVTIGHEGLKDGAAVRLAGEGLSAPAELATPGSGEGSRPSGARGGWDGLPDSLRQVIAKLPPRGQTPARQLAPTSARTARAGRRAATEALARSR